MSDDFDPYYLWLGIPPQERPANHYRLLGVTPFEENPSVIESAADRQMAHLRSVQAGKHAALSQKLLNEVAAAKVCLLRAPQKAKYDQALRAKLDTQASQSKLGAQLPPPVAAPMQPRPLAQAQAIATNDPSQPDSESFWDDVTGSGIAKASAKSTKPQPHVPAAPKPKPNRLKKLWPLFLAAGACVVVGAVVVIRSMSGQAEEATPSAATASPVAAKPKESLLVFDWPDEARTGLMLTVDGAKVMGPPTGVWEYHCPPGPHHVIASRAGFKPIDKMVDAPIDGSRKIADVWQPLATLALDWPQEDRVGAVLNVDGQLLAVGVDQPLVVPVEPGTHTVRITRLGFETLEKNITVAADQHQAMSVALEPTAATLAVRLPMRDRAGTEMRIDGAVHSTANDSTGDWIELPVKPGTHTIAITRPGFNSVSLTMTLAAASRKMIWPRWTRQTNQPPETVAQGPDSKNPGDSAPQVRHPIPSSVDQQRVAKELDKLYKSAHDATKDLAQAKEVCNLALKSEDLSERYMLLLKGADLAIEGGDFSLAMQAVDTLSSEFSIAALDVKEKLLERFVKVAVSGDQIADAVGAADRLIDDAIAADRYEMVTPIASAASKMLVKKSVEPDVRRDSEKTLAAYRAQVKALQPQWDMAQKAKQTLETNPADLDANGTLGRWYCFYKGDWKTGVPYFAKSGNERMKPVAQQELKAATDAMQKALVADQWWDVAQKETGAVADAIHLHAGDLYRSALPDLNSVLKKAAVEKRLAEVLVISSRVADAAGQHSGPQVFPRNRWVDILKLVDVNRDAVAGTWTRDGSEISCGAGNSSLRRISLPVVLDGGYDLEVDFTRTSGNRFVHTIYFAGKQPCGVMLNYSSYSGLDVVNGRALTDYEQNPYTLLYARLQNGRKYQQVISVRIGKGGTVGVDIAVDGKQFIPHWEGDPSTLGVEPQYLAVPKQPALEVGFGDSITLHAVRLRMVSGQGHFESLDTGSSGETPAQQPNRPTSKPFNSSGSNEPDLQKQNADGTIRFAPSDAIFHGKQMKLERPNGNIGYWNDPAEWVEWKFVATRPGIYTVYGEIASESGGNFTLSIGSRSLQATAPSTDSYQKYQLVSLGKIAISMAGTTSLRIKPIQDGWRPVNLQSILLKPSR